MPENGVVVPPGKLRYPISTTGCIKPQGKTLDSFSNTGENA